MLARTTFSLMSLYHTCARANPAPPTSGALAPPTILEVLRITNYELREGAAQVCVSLLPLCFLNDIRNCRAIARSAVIDLATDIKG